MVARRPSARGAIVQLLKQRGELTVQAIADSLGITQVAVRKHLEALLAEKKVAARRVPLPRGRPTYAYYLTELADSFFPQAYDRLAVELLDDLIAIDGAEKLDRLFRARNERLSRTYQLRLQDKDLPERLQELARLRDEEGYMAVLERREGAFVLREHNCPIYDVAQRHREACNCEQDLFSRVLNRDVKRQATLVDGQPCCEYRINE
jgi:predicted ArsR family transcriptional regulator